MPGSVLAHGGSLSTLRRVQICAAGSVLLLSALIALGSSRTALLAEMAVGHDSDHQRALEAAQAMLRDAELEIRGVRPGDTTPGRIRYPRNVDEWIELQAALGASTPSCLGGICLSDRVRPYFWTDPAAFDAMKRVAGGPSAETTRTSWYWVELLPYDMAASTHGGQAEALAPDGATPFIYRVTAAAQGRKPGTRAVVQTTLVWKKERS